MTTPSLPRGLYALASTYATQPAGGVDRTEVEGGAPRYALAWDRGLQTFTVSLFLTPLTFSVWTTWFHHIVKKGALSFTMPLDSGYGEQDHTCNIVPGSVQTSRVGGTRTIVSFTVEAESRAYDLTEADAIAVLAVYEEYGDEADALLRRLARFATVDTLVLDF